MRGHRSSRGIVRRLVSQVLLVIILSFGIFVVTIDSSALLSGLASFANAPGRELRSLWRIGWAYGLFVTLVVVLLLAFEGLTARSERDDAEMAARGESARVSMVVSSGLRVLMCLALHSLFFLLSPQATLRTFGDTASLGRLSLALNMKWYEVRDGLEKWLRSQRGAELSKTDLVIFAPVDSTGEPRKPGSLRERLLPVESMVNVSSCQLIERYAAGEWPLVAEADQIQAARFLMSYGVLVEVRNPRDQRIGGCGEDGPAHSVSGALLTGLPFLPGFLRVMQGLPFGGVLVPAELGPIDDNLYAVDRLDRSLRSFQSDEARDIGIVLRKSGSPGLLGGGDSAAYGSRSVQESVKELVELRLRNLISKHGIGSSSLFPVSSTSEDVQPFGFVYLSPGDSRVPPPGSKGLFVLSSGLPLFFEQGAPCHFLRGGFYEGSQESELALWCSRSGESDTWAVVLLLPRGWPGGGWLALNMPGLRRESEGLNIPSRSSRLLGIQGLRAFLSELPMKSFWVDRSRSREFGAFREAPLSEARAVVFDQLEGMEPGAFEQLMSEARQVIGGSGS